MKKTVSLLILALCFALVSNADAQSQAVLNVCQIRICEYADGTTLRFPFQAGEECHPQFPPGSGNVLVDEYIRVKPIRLDFFDIPKPSLVGGIKFTAPESLIGVAGNLGLPPLLGPDPNLNWPGDLFGPNGECLAFQAPQPIPLDPQFPGGIPLDEMQFAVDSFFDVVFEFPLEIELFGPDIDPLPISIQLNLVPPPLQANMFVCQYQVCRYLNGQQLVRPYLAGMNCPSVLGSTANPLVESFIQTIVKQVEIPQPPFPGSIGGFEITPPPSLFERADDLGLPGVFLPPNVDMLWPFVDLESSALFVPPNPIPLDPQLPHWQFGGPQDPPVMVIDSFFDICTEIDVRHEFVDENFNPMPSDVNIQRALLGDANCDGVVNLLDVAAFVQLIQSSQYSEKADMNGDGLVNLLDVDGFVFVLVNG